VPIAFLKKGIRKKAHAFSEREGNSIRELNRDVMDGIIHKNTLNVFYVLCLKGSF